MSEEASSAHLTRVAYYEADAGPGWDWLDGAARLRKLEEFFPLRAYLNLARREDRRVEAECQFAMQGLDVERMPAVNGRAARNLRRFESAGSYGCALSHRLLLRRARQENVDAVMIFEDDVILHSDFRRLVESLPLPGDWGILFFGCLHVAPPAPASPGLVKVSRAYSTHAFAVRREHLQRVLSMMGQRREPGTRRACDVKLADLAHEIPTYAVWPNLARQATVHSDITGKTIRYYREDGLQDRNRQSISGIPKAMWQLTAAATDQRRRAPERPAPLIVELSGGLGNRLFQWAFGRSLSIETGRPLRFALKRAQDAGSAGPEALGIAMVHEAPDWRTDLIEWEGDCPGDFRRQAIDLLAAVPDRSVMLRGYWQNPDLWGAHKSIIRMELKIPPCPDPLPEGITPVCVQVRRGDYLKSRLHNLCGPDYYLRAMEEMRRRFTRPVFLVFSQDAAWCQAQFRAPDVQVHAPGTAMEHYAAMIKCKAFIIANSTFAWWPAWLSGSCDVICPTPWLNGREWRIAPSHWTRLPALPQSA